MKRFYEPTQEQLTRLDTPWICSYSGGKDSTSLVTWLEWMRRVGWISVASPRLVMSDTGVEYPFLRETSESLMSLLTILGWKCEVVTPRRKDKLYCQILGRGVTPVHPGVRKMRWCTRSTKVDPMKRFKNSLGDLLQLTGIRWGESKIRDEKLLRGGCVAGGECGLPTPGDDKYAAIVNWTDCQIFDWLNGFIAIEGMDDVFSITRKLLKVYKAKKGRLGLDGESHSVEMLRFGCIGCPVISSSGISEYRDNPEIRKHILRIYRVWEQLWKAKHRCIGVRKGRTVLGPIKMESRKWAFAQIIDIQSKSGVKIVSSADIRFIKQCWENNVYPRKWSIADE